MKDIIEEIILTVCIAGLIATCGIHYARKSDARVERWAQEQSPDTWVRNGGVR